MIKRALSTAIAVVFGVIVLLGAFLPDTFIYQWRVLSLRWAMVVGAFAFILAFFQLLRVHLVRMGRQGKGWDVSLIIILSALATTGIVLWERINQQAPDIWSGWLVKNVLVPGESMLLALTSVALIMAGTRVLRVRRNIEGVLFLLVALILLVISIPSVLLPAGIVSPVQRGLDVFTVAGMRGLIIGVALGIVVTGLRALFVTRPYTED